MQNLLERNDLVITQTSCQHHWVIDEPVRETVTGVCKNCGKRRNFSGNGGEVVREQERVADMEYWSVGEIKEVAAVAE